MKIWEVKEEMALYDERNGRTITVTDTALFTLQELTHFKEI